MRSHWLITVFALTTAACSPACKPPPADPPHGGGNSQQAAGGPNAGAAAAGQPRVQPEPDTAREAPGVDLSQLSEAQRDVFFQIALSEPSACGKPHSLVKSLQTDAQCRASRTLAQFVADRVAAGTPVETIQTTVASLAKHLEVHEISIANRPVYGSDKAPVTIVVFADYECPHCAAEAPVLRSAVQKFRGQAKLVFRNFPLSGHERAKPAAFACEAAFKQGKFWEMNEKVFAHQSDLEDDDLLDYAKEIGLDLEKFKTDMSSAEVAAAVETDRADGEKLQIEGTPAVYINGRLYHPALFGGSVEGWIDDALRN